MTNEYGSGTRMNLAFPRLGLAVITAVSVLVLMAALPAPSHAAHFSVAVIPAQIELTLEPGTRSPQQLEVRNHADDPIDLLVFVRDFDLLADGSFEMLEPGHTTYSAGRWLDFPVDEMRLKPGEYRTIDYGIVVPPDAEPGGHYAAIVVEGTTSGSSDADDESHVQIIGRVVSQVLITIPGPITRNLQIDALELPLVAFGAGADTARVRITNTGNVHLTPNGYVQTWGGLPAKSYDETFGQFTLLPGASRDLEVSLENLPWLGRMRAKTELQYGPRIGMFDRSVETSVEYFVISWKVILIASLVLIGFDVVLFREWRRRVAARKQEGATADGTATATAAAIPDETPDDS